LETDAPYLSPQPVRKETNQSKYIEFVIENIAAIKGVSPEMVVTQTNRNAHELFARGL
jgi:TatD DNase family protein